MLITDGMRARRLTRRAVLRVAAGAVSLAVSTGCAALDLIPSSRRSASSGAPTADVVLLGLPSSAGLQALLTGWVTAEPRIRTAGGPDAWLCPGAAWRTPAPSYLGGLAPAFPFQGRTVLGFAYGGSAPPQPSVPGTPQSVPDVIVTTTVWLYWIAWLLSDLTDPLQAPDRRAQLDGVPQDVLDQGIVFSPGRGSFRAAVPVLRNPVGLAGGVAGPPGEGGVPLEAAPASVPWRWTDLLALIGETGGSVSGGTGFVPATAHPTPLELAAAVAVAYGGNFGTPPKLNGSGAIQGLSDTRLLFAAGGGPTAQGTVSVMAGHLMPPYGNARGYTPAEPWWPMPVPSGPNGRAVPVAHVIAAIPEKAAHPDLAADFVASLLSPAGQQRLRAWNGGLLLRPADALAQLANDHPKVQRPHDWVDASADLAPARLWGSALTDASAPMAYAAADAWGAALRMLRTSQAPSDVRRVADDAQSNLAAVMPSLTPLRLGAC